MIKQYEVVLIGTHGDERLEVREHTVMLGEVTGTNVVTNPQARKKAIEFALREMTNEKGTRVLSQGQSAVISSILTAENLRNSELDQETWSKAAEAELEKGVSSEHQLGELSEPASASSGESNCQVIQFPKRKQ